MRTAFYFWLYRDEALALKLVQQIRRWHGDREIIAITDGLTLDSDVMLNLYDLGVKVIFTEQRLKLPQFGGRFLARNYDLLLRACSAEMFIKLDPDSSVNSPVHPLTSPWYGQVHQVGHRTLGVFSFTWGCGMGLSRGAIARLISSERLDGPDYFGIGHPVQDGSMVLTEDLVLAHALMAIGYEPVPWKDVALYGKWFEGMPNDQYAITHPVKKEHNVHT